MQPSIIPRIEGRKVASCATISASDYALLSLSSHDQKPTDLALILGALGDPEEGSGCSEHGGQKTCDTKSH